MNYWTGLKDFNPTSHSIFILNSCYNGPSNFIFILPYSNIFNT